MGWFGISRAPSDSEPLRPTTLRQLAVCFRSVPYHAPPRQKSRRFTLPTSKFPNDEREVNDNIDGNTHTFTCRSRLKLLPSSMIHPRVDMFKLNSMVIRPCLMRTTRITTLSNRRFSSTLESESSTPPLPVDGYKLPSGDTIPSVGLGTWRASEEDVGRAFKVAVVPEESFNQGEP